MLKSTRWAKTSQLLPIYDGEQKVSLPSGHTNVAPPPESAIPLITVRIGVPGAIP